MARSELVWFRHYPILPSVLLLTVAFLTTNSLHPAIRHSIEHTAHTLGWDGEGGVSTDKQTTSKPVTAYSTQSLNCPGAAG